MTSTFRAIALVLTIGLLGWGYVSTARYFAQRNGAYDTRLGEAERQSRFGMAVMWPIFIPEIFGGGDRYTEERLWGDDLAWMDRTGRDCADLYGNYPVYLRMRCL